MKQQFDNYTERDLLVWKTLFERQRENLTDKASKEYIYALDGMKEVLSADQVPNFDKMKGWFESSTGWSIHCVPGLIPVDEFFQVLADKRFPSSTWLRKMEQLDYLEEPDMFHDIFGHVPLLSNPIFSKFMQKFGELGCQHLNDPIKLVQLQRLYWFTIEFGLIKSNGLKIYGAGIASSFGESNYCVTDEVEKRNFDVEEVINTPFHTDAIQTHYVVIESFEQLFDSLDELSKLWNSKTYDYVLD